MAYIGRGPVKSGAFRIIDDIASSFNGSTTGFTLQHNSSNVTPGTEQNLLIAVDGVMQEPQSAFTISGSTITFTSAPASGASFWGVELGDVGGIASTVANGTVDTAQLVADAVDGTKIADNAIDSEHYVDGSIDLAHMSSQSVDEDNLYISNAGNNGEFLSKQSGNAGGLTWATAGGNAFTNDVTVTSGNVVMATAGRGIDFSANTHSAVTGASMTSELLDWYEEGTWTPTFLDPSKSTSESQTYSQQYGHYQRIGNRVFFNFRLTLTSLGTLSGGATYIGGLPFANISGTGNDSGGIIFYMYNMSFSAAGFVSLFIEPNQTTAELYHLRGTTVVYQMNVNQWTNSTVLMGSGQYRVA